MVKPKDVKNKDEISIKHSYHKLNTRLREIERELVDFTVDMSSFRQENSKKSIFLAYMIFNEHLTQEQIHKLTKKSRGNVSSSLSSLVDSKQIIKKFNTNTRTYEYSLNPNRSSSTLTITGGKDTLSKEINYFEAIKKKLHEKEFKETESIESFKNRIDQMIKTYHFLGLISETMMKIMLNPKDEFLPIDLINIPPKFSKFLIIEELDEEIIEIENDIIDHLTSNQVLRQNNEITAKILAYFYTRGILTQEDIQEKTKFSAGAVSKAIRELERFGYIKKEIPRKRPYRYLMRSIPHAIASLFVLSLEKILTWIPKLQKIKSEIENMKEVVSEPSSFEKIKTFVEAILKITPVYTHLINSLNKMLSDAF
jgi:DNA-binding transcriptional regulator GbsR (MarR family)